MSQSAHSQAVPAQRRSRLAATLGAAFALICAAIIGVDISEGLAGDFFDDLFGGRPRAYVVEQLHFGNPYAQRVKRHRQSRYRATRIAAAAALKKKHALLRRAGSNGVKVASKLVPKTAAWPAAKTPVASMLPSSRRFVCVRSCDGHFIPVAHGSGRDGQPSCEKACPGSEAKLFSVPAGGDLAEATSVSNGEAYSAVLARIGAGKRDDQACSCGATTAANRPAGAIDSYMSDPTLRPGDTVVTPQGVRVLRSGSHYPFKRTDFLALADTRDVPMATRGALAAIERVLRTPHGRLSVMNERSRAERRMGREQRSDAGSPSSSGLN